jgi:hypothetical protein
VGATFQLSEERKAGEIFVLDSPHLENIVGTDLDAITLAFARIAIDDGIKCAGIRPTVFARTIRAPRRAFSLLSSGGVAARLPCFSPDIIS